MRVALLALLSALGLAACGTPPGIACPPVVAYSRAFEARLLAELEALPPSAALGEFVADAITLRDAARACRNPVN